MYKKITFLFLIILYIPGVTLGDDFEKLCSYFRGVDEVLRTESDRNFNIYQYIDKNVNTNLTSDSPARQTWQVIIYAVPDKRYDMVKSTAEEILQKKWHCDAMKKYLPILGE